jgi:hypothetical protein
VAAVSAGGQQRAKAWECGPTLESQQAAEASAPSIELDPKKYSGSEEERFGPTLAAEHLAEEDGIALDHDTVRLCSEPGDRSAARWNTHLRFALTAGLRFSAHSSETPHYKKGTLLNS